MKYWIFQSNQVLGPYAPEDLSRLPSFNAESLVCPEGRKGTSMGDWQRAGMVADLSVALIKASSAQNVKSPVASLAGLPPEPTLKDLAVLGSLQEKMCMLEDVVLQLQEGLRVKDAELANLHVEIAGKTQESSELRRDSEQLRREIEMRRREAEVLKAETDEFKRSITALEERVSTVNRLTETIDKAVEAEKHVEHDVEVQGATIAGLTQEIESLREQMRDRLASASASATVVSASPSGLPDAAAAFPDIAPTEKTPDAPPEVHLEAPRETPPETPDEKSPAQTAAAPTDLPDIAPEPAFGVTKPLPSFDATSPVPSFLPTIEPPPAPASEVPAGMIAFDPLAPQTPQPEVEAAAPVDAVAPPPPAPSRKKALAVGGVLGVAALAGLAFLSGKVPGLSPRKPAVDLTTPAPMPAPSEPPPVEEPAVDERQAAIDFTKQWGIKNGETVGQALEKLSPSNGNLSPWMAEPLSSGRVQVNYFSRGSAPGSPTVAYEFEVDLSAKTLSARNAAAKAVVAGKAAAPPAPKRSRPVKVKPKAEAAPPLEEGLDALLGDPAAASKPAEPDAATKSAEPEAAPRPVKATHAKRAAKAAKEVDDKAEDASLLDDLLKE